MSVPGGDSWRAVGALDGAEPGATLAAGLAHHVRAWSLKLGAGSEAADAAALAAQRLVLAEAAGHVCLPAAEGPPQAALQASHCVGSPEAPGTCPMILDHQGRLYLHRNWALEGRLAARLRAALHAPPLPLPEGAAQRLEALFPPRPGSSGGLDSQRLAVALALRRRLVVVSGGPGTGKTHVAALLIQALLESDLGLRVALAAPTGKAAARLGERLRARGGALPPGLSDVWPQRAHTVHRLLEAGPRGFAHNAERPLPLDLLVVDEASMLDMALATALLDALPATARLVLLGDSHQLAAVEAGAVFGALSAAPAFSPPMVESMAALCGVPASSLPAAGPESGFADASVRLQRPQRFAAGSTIARAADAARQGDAAGLIAAVDNVALQWLADPDTQASGAIWQAVEAGYGPYLEQLRRDPLDPAAAWAAFANFRVLCAVREGPHGAVAINRRMTAALSLKHGLGFGQPVMVLRNEPALDLFNGDIGLLLPGSDGRVDAVFAAPDGGLRRLPPERLPTHEPAWAATVHKAQGSEFDRVLLLLPATPVRVLGRELVYTGLTRARQQVLLCAPKPVLTLALARESRRASGLADRLRAPADD